MQSFSRPFRPSFALDRVGTPLQRAVTVYTIPEVVNKVIRTSVGAIAVVVGTMGCISLARVAALGCRCRPMIRGEDHSGLFLKHGVVCGIGESIRDKHVL